MKTSTLDRRAFVKSLLSTRGNTLVVTGLGSATYDAAAAGDDDRNFYLWGAMGAAAMVGLGLALARPDRRVSVITGDGEMLMGLGALATIGVKQPKNLSIIVLDNTHYGETGMQASHTHAGVDLVAIAIACRFNAVLDMHRESQVDEARRLMYHEPGPTFVRALIQANDPPRVLPLRDGVLIRHRFMKAVG